MNYKKIFCIILSFLLVLPLFSFIPLNAADTEEETVEVTAKIKWVDWDRETGEMTDLDKDENRPSKIDGYLIGIPVNGDDEFLDSTHIVLDEQNNWEVTKTLPKYRDYENNKTEINYVFHLDEGYDISEDGYMVAKRENNVLYLAPEKNKTEYKTISIKNIWDDGNDEDGVRPDTVDYVIKADGEPVSVITLTDENGWTEQTAVLPIMNKDNKIINYTIGLPYKSDDESEYSYEGLKTESEIVEYWTTYNAETDNDGNIHFTATHKHLVIHPPIKRDGIIYKEWNDDNDKAGTRPDKVTIDIYLDGEKVDTVDVTAENDWTAEFLVDEYKDGKLIYEDYEYKEEPVEGYTSQIDTYTEDSAIGVTVTNTYSPAPDEADKPSDRETTEKAEETTETIENTESTEITEVTTESTESTEVTESTEETKPEKEIVSLTVKKKWDDNKDSDKIRPDNITVNLLADGEKIDSVKITKDNKWKYRFDNLPKYQNGKEIKYSITEDEVKGYTTTYSGSTSKGFVITNKHTPEKSTDSSSSDQSSDSSSDSTSKDSDSQTGDASKPELYLLLLGLAGFGAAGITVGKKKSLI